MKTTTKVCPECDPLLEALKPFAGLEIARYSASGMQAFVKSGMHKIPDEWAFLIPAILNARAAIAKATQP